MILDVSVYQGVINWAQIKADAIALVIIKATEGVGYMDPRFAQNWAGAKAAGVARGAYHFARPDAGNNPIAEAEYFLSVLAAHGLLPSDRLAEDYEVAGGGPAWSLAFLGDLQAKTGILPEFYSNYNGCSHVASDARMAQYPLWLAYPGDGVHVPPAPAPWKSIALWQYRVGTVPGISGGVDEDVNLGLLAGSPAGHLEEPDMTPGLASLLSELANLIGLGRLAGSYPDGTPGDKAVADAILAAANSPQPVDWVGPTLGSIVNSPEGQAWLAKLAWLHQNLNYDPTTKAVTLKATTVLADDDTALASAVQQAQAAATAASAAAAVAQTSAAKVESAVTKAAQELAQA